MIKNIIIKTIKFYQVVISPLLGSNCRFYPTCSEYSVQALKKYGIARGLLKSAKRMAKCNQWFPGGLDLP